MNKTEDDKKPPAEEIFQCTADECKRCGASWCCGCVPLRQHCDYCKSKKR